MDMVCENINFKTMANSIYIVGSLVGAIISGPLIDELVTSYYSHKP